MAKAAGAPRRPDFHYGERAFRTLSAYLRQNGLIERVREVAAGPALAQRMTVLPGFHLADRGEISPYQWCVPRPADEGDLINVYEEYVNRPLGRTRMPDTVARKLYRSRATGQQYFGPRRRAAAWRLPAAKLVLAAAHFGAEVKRFQGGLQARLGDYLLSVSADGCYSNMRAMALTYPGGGEIEIDLAVPSYRTWSPVAAALVEAGVDQSALWALSTVLRAKAYRGLPLEDLLTPREKPARKPRQRNPDDVNEAAREAIEVAEQCEEGALRELYEAMVPRVCSAIKFKEEFGNPYRPGEDGRAIRSSTRRVWVSRIETLASEASRAVA